MVAKESVDTVTYSVQLNRDNQQLGIVLGRIVAYNNRHCTWHSYDRLGLSQSGDFMIKALNDGVARRCELMCQSVVVFIVVTLTEPVQ